MKGNIGQRWFFVDITCRKNFWLPSTYLLVCWTRFIVCGNCNFFNLNLVWPICNMYLAEPIWFIFSVHVPLRKAAAREVKVDRVIRYKSRIENIFYLKYSRYFQLSGDIFQSYLWQLNQSASQWSNVKYAAVKQSDLKVRVGISCHVCKRK